MTIDDQLLRAVDAAAQTDGETRSAFIRQALHTELRRRENAQKVAAHRASFIAQPDDDVWQPAVRAWGDE